MPNNFEKIINDYITSDNFKMTCKCAHCKKCKSSSQECPNDTFKYKIYNEFSLQHELGKYLEKENFEVFYEKNVYTILEKEDAKKCVKKEIDIIAIKNNKIYAIELKFPIKNGQFPEQMFQFIKDISFMEQLKSNWRNRKENLRNYKTINCYCLTIVCNHNYYRDDVETEIGKNYEFFRGNKLSEITGKITNHIKKKNNKGKLLEPEILTLEYHYPVKWLPVSENHFMRYYCIKI